MSLIRAVIVLAVALGIGGCAAKPRLDADPDAVRAALESLLSGDSAAPYIAERRDVAKAAYAARDFAPLWIDGEPTDRLRALIDAVCTSDREGLHPAEYELAEIRDTLRAIEERGRPDPATIAALELRFTGLFLQYATDLAAGRHDPRRVEEQWYIRTPKRVIDSMLTAALAASTFEEMRAAVVPPQEEYADLAEALRTYRRIDSAGGWPRVPAGDAVTVGERDPRAAVLRRRLVATGDLETAGATDSVYDAELAAAVARFQARHGIDVDSVVGENTLAAMNVPVADRIRQIELNLERLRWVPRRFGERYVLVNIPDYYLHAYDSGRRVLDMRVVVGEEYGGATPVFSDSMSYVVFRPYWNIPQSILAEEILPKAKADPSFLARNNYEIVRSVEDPEPVSLSDIEWSGPEDGDFPYLARQKPGGQNALGLVKFMFPNRFAIYLHDTPADHLFQETERAYSHGCIRVEHPVQLAEFVFRGSSQWTEPRIRQAMSAGAEDSRTVGLDSKVPVYIMYLTAFTQDGQVHFREDLYGMDAAALKQLATDSDTDVTGVCAELRELLRG